MKHLGASRRPMAKCDPAGAIPGTPSPSSASESCRGGPRRSRDGSGSAENEVARTHVRDCPLLNAVTASSTCGGPRRSPQALRGGALYKREGRRLRREEPQTRVTVARSHLETVKEGRYALHQPGLHATGNSDRPARGCADRSNLQESRDEHAGLSCRALA